MSEAERKRIEHAATPVDTLAANTTMAGLLGPVAGLLYGVSHAASDRRWAAGCHQGQRFVVGGLDAHLVNLAAPLPIAASVAG